MKTLKRISKSKSENQIFTLNSPSYIVDGMKFKTNLHIIQHSFSEEWGENLALGYSIKTNHNPELLKIAKEEGMMAEVVSDDEYNMALACGYHPKEIIFNGPQKSSKLLISALKAGSTVNLDNNEELEIIKSHIEELKDIDIKLGIRINFNLEDVCQGETTAGNEVSRFGFCVENNDFELAVSTIHELGISVKGLHMHYSSKSRSINIFSALAKTAVSLVEKYNLDSEIEFIDMGGGFFLGGEERMQGRPTMDEYAKVIISELSNRLSPRKVKLILEPGASILASAVDYICQVINVKQVRGTNVVTIDGSSLDINPFSAEREPVYDILVKKKGKRNEIKKQIICGATCMENDRIAILKNSELIEKGDYLYCYCSGAYTMSFNNCFINLPPYIYLKEKNQYKLIRGKQENLSFLI